MANFPVLTFDPEPHSLERKSLLLFFIFICVCEVHRYSLCDPAANMSSEQICYTIINNPTETEAPNEQQLKQDIGMSIKRGSGEAFCSE